MNHLDMNSIAICTDISENTTVVVLMLPIQVGVKLTPLTFLTIATFSHTIN